MSGDADYYDIAWSVRSAVRSSVTHVHPGKAVWWNKTQFGKNTRVILADAVILLSTQAVLLRVNMIDREKWHLAIVSCLGQLSVSTILR